MDTDFQAFNQEGQMAMVTPEQPDEPMTTLPDGLGDEESTFGNEPEILNPQDYLEMGQDEVCDLANDCRRLRLTFTNIVPDETLGQADINLDCSGCHNLIMPNPTETDEWKQARQCMTCHKASCWDCAAKDYCHVCQQEKLFSDYLSDSFNAVLERLTLKCPICKAQNPYREALYHSLTHQEDEPTSGDGAPMQIGQTVGQPSSGGSGDCCPKCSKLEEQLKDQEEAMRKIARFEHMRGARHFMEIVHIFREMAAIVKPALDQRIGTVPITEVSKIYSKLGKFISEKKKREVFGLDDIIEIRLRGEQEVLDAMRENLKLEGESYVKFISEVNAAKDGLQKKAEEFKNQPGRQKFAWRQQPKEEAKSNPQAVIAQIDEQLLAMKSSMNGSSLSDQLPQVQVPSHRSSLPQVKPILSSKPEKASIFSGKGIFGLGKKKAGPAPPHKCPRGHPMNSEPMTDSSNLGQIHRALEEHNNLEKGAIASGRFICGGVICAKGKGTRLRDKAAGWHMCSQRSNCLLHHRSVCGAYDTCDYKMVCHRCYQAGSRGYK